MSNLTRGVHVLHRGRYSRVVPHSEGNMLISQGKIDYSLTEGPTFPVKQEWVTSSYWVRDVHLLVNLGLFLLMV